MSPAPAPLTWTLWGEASGAAGEVLASGLTEPGGFDAASGDHTHRVDFSAYQQPGSPLWIEVGGVRSDPFAIADGLYGPLAEDARLFFYHQRSGAPIEAAVVGQRHARPAGHLGVAPNGDDSAVPCQPRATSGDPAWDTGCPQGCTLDLRGGWYDAGDQGKYTVNGAFAVWLLLHADEFGLVETAGLDREALLDEARWEVEFLLRMQVPAGHPGAGLAYHKVHDQAWTPIPTRPEEDPQPRQVHPASTIAAFTLAAVGAQAARRWRDRDPEFADRCLAAAELAWQAALANPGRVASSDASLGGGPYDDVDPTDDRYWAAAELFVTTGAPEYRDAVTGSPHFPGRSVPGGFTWNATAPLGDLALLSTPNGLTDQAAGPIADAIVHAADTALGWVGSQGYPAPFGPKSYPWGSNGDVAHWGTYLAVAAWLTGRPEYRDAALAGLDYLLGRNPLGLSYITGYGTRPVHHLHHRLWAPEVDPALPPAPPGALAGGPNTDLEDEVARAALAGRPAQRCYLDDIQAYSTNEVAVNWNAGLYWITAYAAGAVHQPSTEQT